MTVAEKLPILNSFSSRSLGCRYRFFTPYDYVRCFCFWGAEWI